MTLSESLKRFRKEFDLTQKDVADVLNITPQSYRVYEVNVKPSAEVIIKIADAFNVSADYLLGRCNNPKGINTTNLDTEIVQAAIAFHDALHKALDKSELNHVEE